MNLEDQWKIIDPFGMGHRPGEIMVTDKMLLPDWKPHLPPEVPQNVIPWRSIIKVSSLSAAIGLLAFWISKAMLS